MKSSIFTSANFFKVLKAIGAIVTILGSSYKLYEYFNKSNNQGPPRFHNHIVRRGDSLSKLSYYYQVDLEEVIYYNKMFGLINDPDLIYPGQKIKIPKNSKDNFYQSFILSE